MAFEPCQHYFPTSNQFEPCVHCGVLQIALQAQKRVRETTEFSQNNTPAPPVEVKKELKDSTPFEQDYDQ